jgi:hypothetical protein
MTAPKAAEVEALVERLRKRAKEDRQCAENNRVVAGLLEPQFAAFNAREEPWNTYAVRMAVDHRNSLKRDEQWADDLDAAVAIILAAHPRKGE